MLKLLNKIILLFLFFIISCTSIENTIDNTEKIDVKKIASEKFGKKFSLDYNSSKEFVICQNRSEANNSRIEYFIYDINKNQIVETNSFPLGNISWLSEFEVRVEIHPGIIQKNVQPSIGYILNVKTNLKTNINGGVH
ncbi:MAG: hypothetical protein L3J41_02260 [Melioribacteraceae bacterium]|nr:hypothetical protein [Melioribacteraceae bacterium]